MFGRGPRLPTESLLGLALEDKRTGSVDEWLESHSRRLNYVLERVRRNTNRAIHARKTRQARQANDPGIRIGSRVFLRNHTISHAKIQDAWKPTPYKVLSCLEGGNVYIIQPADGFGVTKAVHRAEMLDSKEMVPNNENTELPSDDNQEAVALPTDSNSSMSSDSEEDLDIVRFRGIVPRVDDAVNQGEHGGQLPDTVGTTDNERQDVRRSVRTTAGTHTNMHRQALLLCRV